VAFDPWQAWPMNAALRGAATGGPSGAHPFEQVAERFQAAARAFMAAAGTVPGGTAPNAAEAFHHFLRQQFAELKLPWQLDPRQAPTGNLFDGQALGATRENQERLQRMSEAAQRLLEAQRRLQLLWSDALREAASAYTAQLSGEPPGDPSAESMRALYDRWIDCAEDAYGRVAHSEAFCDGLADFINASGEWRAEMQAAAEQWAKRLDLPTRSEVNSLLERVEALERAQRAKPAARRTRGTPKPD
jgi:class III poly(R)-hydroxyalkanoic acid synthase PhaE subunit